MPQKIRLAEYSPTKLNTKVQNFGKKKANRGMQKNFFLGLEHGPSNQSSKRGIVGPFFSSNVGSMHRQPLDSPENWRLKMQSNAFKTLKKAVKCLEILGKHLP